MDGIVLGTVTLGRNLFRLASYFGLKYKEIPVGFHHASDLMRSQNVMIAVEENGGIGFGFYLPERDAILSAGLLVEAACSVNGGILSILKNIPAIDRAFSLPSIERRDIFMQKTHFGNFFKKIA